MHRPDAPELAELQARLAAAEEALRAIRAGEVDAVVVVQRDGSRQVFAREGSTEPYRLLIEQMYEGAAMLSVEGDILYGNRRLAELLGLPLEQLVGTALRSYFAAAEHEPLRALMRAALRNGHGSGEFHAQAAAGGALPLRLAFNAMPERTGAALGLVASDLSESRRVAAELDRYRLHLEALVTERTLALEAAQAAGRAKAAFLANMSHEIRTPLNAVLGLAHLLRREPLSPAQAGRVGLIEKAGRHLLALIVDVLDLSRIEADQMRLEPAPVDLEALQHDVLTLLADEARAKGLHLAVDRDAAAQPLPTLLGDRTRLLQAMLNLASNAVKFTDRGHVLLRLRCTGRSERGLQLRFEVEDSGIGVNAEVAPRLFKPFEQGDASATRRHGGSGLGLALTRRLAQLMGGGCGVEPRPGGGSIFWFTVELALAPVAGRAGGPPAPAHSAETELRARHAGRRVLLVDDEPLNREVAQALLEMPGLAVEVAVDGVDALARVAQGPVPAVILMDVQMPVMDGLEAARRLRALPQTSGVPIIAMTANAFAEDREACLTAGMDDFISKPIETETLFGLLLRWMPTAARH